MAKSKKTISDEVLSVLRDVTCDGYKVRITQQLSRPLYLATAKALQTLGGKWSRKDEAVVFEDDPAPLIADCVATGAYVDYKKVFQFYETPSNIVHKMLDAAEEIVPLNGARVLEPSAGAGAITRPLIQRGAVVDCVELDATRIAQLTYCNCVVCDDFLARKPGAGLASSYDLVVMNPPFSRLQDIQHVRHAVTFVRPGGGLVAVVSSSYSFNRARLACDFREWLRTQVFTSKPLPLDAFKASGAMVSTVLLSIKC